MSKAEGVVGGVASDSVIGVWKCVPCVGAAVMGGCVGIGRMLVLCVVVCVLVVEV